ncbi:MAG: hypothetical protein RRY22_06050 [Bacilli bacterium]
MQRIVSILFIFIFPFYFSQEKEKIEKSIIGVQIGLFGGDIYNEARVSNNISIRTQISLNPSLWGGDLYSETGFALTPSISISPKIYYNLDKRSEKGYNTKNNSANYFSAKLEYIPNLFVISSNKDVYVNEMISLTPSYGLRRNFATNFNYELTLGIGVGKILKRNYDLQVIPNISFKVGYDF